MIAASVSTRVVSWNAAEMKESVDSEALVIPSSTFSYCAGACLRPRRSIVLVQHLGAFDLLFADELGIARIGDDHATQHLANDHLDVLVVDLHALKAVHVLRTSSMM